MIALGTDLAGFIREHEYCGELGTGLEGDRGAALMRALAFD